MENNSSEILSVLQNILVELKQMNKAIDEVGDLIVKAAEITMDISCVNSITDVCDRLDEIQDSVKSIAKKDEGNSSENSYSISYQILYSTLK